MSEQHGHALTVNWINAEDEVKGGRSGRFIWYLMRGKSSAVHVAYHSVQSAIVVDSMPFGGVKGKIYSNYEVTEKKRSDAVR